jgi:hypothetical protein
MVTLLIIITDTFTPHKRNTHDKQEKHLYGVTWLIWIFVLLNFGIGGYYLYWRVSPGSGPNQFSDDNTIYGIPQNLFDLKTADDLDNRELNSTPPIWLIAYAWLYYGAECCLVLAIWIGHTQRLFPVQVRLLLIRGRGWAGVSI